MVHVSRKPHNAAERIHLRHHGNHERNLWNIYFKRKQRQPEMIGHILGIAAPIIDKFVEDKDAKANLKAQLQSELIALDAAQAQANIEAAKHPSIFVAGARPAIMWICALGLMTNFFIMPIAEWAVAIWAPGIELPQLETGELMTLTLSLLGLGGMRSFEKTKGIARENLK